MSNTSSSAHTHICEWLNEHNVLWISNRECSWDRSPGKKKRGNIYFDLYWTKPLNPVCGPFMKEEIMAAKERKQREIKEGEREGREIPDLSEILFQINRSRTEKPK